MLPAGLPAHAARKICLTIKREEGGLPVWKAISLWYGRGGKSPSGSMGVI